MIIREAISKMPNGPLFRLRALACRKVKSKGPSLGPALIVTIRGFSPPQKRRARSQGSRGQAISKPISNYEVYLLRNSLFLVRYSAVLFWMSLTSNHFPVLERLLLFKWRIMVFTPNFVNLSRRTRFPKGRAAWSSTLIIRVYVFLQLSWQISGPL